MAPVDMGYYELLEVSVEFTPTELKKAYRKQAMKYHPDKNSSPEAEEIFKDISKAYQVLSDPDLRAAYDRNGKAMDDRDGAFKMEDATDFFANVFGGDRFKDYIGELSLMKQIKTAAAMMTEEEKAELERAANQQSPRAMLSDRNSHWPSPSSSSPSPGVTSPSNPTSPEATTPSTSDSRNRSPQAPEAKWSSEQREAASKALKERVATLALQLMERLRPYVDAKRPGDPSDPETQAFETRIRREAEDMKLESFGVELLHAIGSVYMMKATSFMKSKKFLGIPGFFSRLKEQGSLAKEAWVTLGSAIEVQQIFHDMDKLQSKGRLGDEELKAFEEDMTGKVLLASWRGTRFEVIQVLREVCHVVLKDNSVSDMTLYHRAKGLLVIGAIFKSIEPDESDAERRELEKIVADAAAGKSKRQQQKAQAKLNLRLDDKRKSQTEAADKRKSTTPLSQPSTPA